MDRLRTLMAQQAALTFRVEDKIAVKLKHCGVCNSKISYKVSYINWKKKKRCRALKCTGKKSSLRQL